MIKESVHKKITWKKPVCAGSIPVGPGSRNTARSRKQIRHRNMGDCSKFGDETWAMAVHSVIVMKKCE